MPYADILVDVADGVNAYTPTMGHQLAEAFAACDADDAVS